MLAQILAAASAASASNVPALSASVAPQRMTLQVSAGQLLKMADGAAARGDRAAARRAYRALMQDASSDVRLEARFRLAMLDRTEGKLGDAAVLLRQVVDSRPDAVRARLELASVLDKLGDQDGAWRQMRAIHASGLPANVARLIDRYSEALRAARPFGASLEIAVAPNSNINSATRSDTLGTVFGDFDIGKESQAKSGLGLALRGQGFRRVGLGDDGRSLLVRLSGSADLYKARAFNDIAVDLAAGPELRIGRDRLNVEAGATQRWFGQKPFMRSVRLGATWVHPLGTRTQVRATATGALIDNQINDLQDGKLWSGELSVERALSATTGIALTGSATRQSLKDPAYSTRSWRLGAVGWRDLGRLTLTLGGEIGRLRADDRLSLLPDRRADRYSRLTLGATFRRLNFRGFAPVARFTIERNKSSVAFYDYSRKRTEFGFQRAF